MTIKLAETSVAIAKTLSEMKDVEGLLLNVIKSLLEGVHPVELMSQIKEAAELSISTHKQGQQALEDLGNIAFGEE